MITHQMLSLLPIFFIFHSTAPISEATQPFSLVCIAPRYCKHVDSFSKKKNWKHSSFKLERCQREYVTNRTGENIQYYHINAVFLFKSMPKPTKVQLLFDDFFFLHRNVYLKSPSTRNVLFVCLIIAIHFSAAHYR